MFSLFLPSAKQDSAKPAPGLCSAARKDFQYLGSFYKFHCPNLEVPRAPPSFGRVAQLLAVK
jgi:hypothetical protein